MLKAIKNWWNKVRCHHSYRVLERFPVYDCNTTYHSVVGYQTVFICDKCGKTKSIMN